MRIAPNQPAPELGTTDIQGRPVSLQALRGRRVLLSFMRNAGCPICNFRVHELRQKADSLRAANTDVILVYESSAATLREYLEGEAVPFTFVSDPDQQLYARYGVEKSFGKVLRGVAKGAVGKARAGQALFKREVAKDGNMTRIGADFLIDANGRIEQAYYGKFVGDHLPI